MLKINNRARLFVFFGVYCAGVVAHFALGRKMWAQRMGGGEWTPRESIMLLR
jgi:hypothetical protein